MAGRDEFPSVPIERDPLQRFQNLMPHRIRKVLLVASLYDSFQLAEDGQLQDLLQPELVDVQVDMNPWVTRVSTGKEALETLQKHERSYDLVLSATHLGDMRVLEFAPRLEGMAPQIPVVILAFDDVELQEILEAPKPRNVENVFAWQGDSRLLLAIVRSIEDRWNLEEDTRLVGVSSILLIEDNVHDASAFLPILYAELMKQSVRVMLEGLNKTNKIMRLRARPKILLCTTYEQALYYYRKYHETVLGIISDISFPRGGKPDPFAGIAFARMVRSRDAEVPIILQTRDTVAAERARGVKASVLYKDEPNFHHELTRYLLHNFGFGDFVFLRPDGSEIDRSETLAEMEEALRTVPEDSLVFHAERNHFSTWLRARTEFRLAEAIRPQKVSDFSSPEAIRDHLIRSIHEFRLERQTSFVAAFSRHQFLPRASFAQLGGGSLGGKARGLAFIRQVLYRYGVRNRFPGVQIFVPAGIVIATDIFDEFLDRNGLRDFALRETDDQEIVRRFLAARFPDSVYGQLRDFLEVASYPLSVRSSSLLEDSQYLPYAGVYETYMVPNSHPDPKVRTIELIQAIKRVYASTFSQQAKAYTLATPYRVEEERMAVIVQRLIGASHGPRFYPDFAGVARSYNFYPSPPMAAADGIATVALGLGRSVEEGHKVLRFSPRHPHHPVQFSSTPDILRNAQTTFYALDLEGPDSRPDLMAPLKLTRYGLETALEDGTLARLGSTYSHENDAVYDGIGRRGAPLVTFAPILKHGLFPLPEILRLLLDLGEKSLNRPVEIEFAATLSTPPGRPQEFAFLQMRPFLVDREREGIDLDAFRREDLLCSSRMVLGNGRVQDVRDVVFVDRDRFDRARSRDVAREVARLNARLASRHRPYVLIGVGRWGASDPWLGIPVTWAQIAGARVIVEAAFRDMNVTPSQGSHFFQNLTTSMTGYYTIDDREEAGFVDWRWLQAQPVVEECGEVRHVRFEEPLGVHMDGAQGRGIIVKPGVRTRDPGSA